MAEKKSNVKGALFALTAFGIFSVHDVVVKYLGGNYSPFQTLFFSVLLGFPLVMIMLIQDQDADTLRPRHPWWVALRSAATVVTGLCAFYAFSVLPLAQTYAVLFATPLLITILSIPVLGETVRLRRWLAVIVGLGGVMIVLRPGSAELGWGHLAALGASVGGAINSIVVRKIGNEERNVVLMTYPMVASFIVMAIALPFVYQPMPLVDLAATAVISVLAFVAVLFLIAAYKTGEAVVAAPMQYSQIIWAVLFGALFFDERIDKATFVGASVIIGSGLYILFRESRTGASANTPVLRARTRVGIATGLRVGPILRRRERARKADNSEPK